MTIHTLRALKDNFIYALVDEGQCAIVDPGEAAPVQQFLARHGLRLTHILCTHHHHDHVDGISALQSATGCRVLSSYIDKSRVCGVTDPVRENDPFTLFGAPMKIFEVPGHTQGQIAYYFPTLKAVFPGDTLFSCGCGRLFEGSPEQMFSSMVKLRSLPADTKVYFGHEYTIRNAEFLLAQGQNEAVRIHKEQCERRVQQGFDTTPTELALEIKINPFLNAATAAEFARWRDLRNHW